MNFIIANLRLPNPPGPRAAGDYLVDTTMPILSIPAVSASAEAGAPDSEDFQATPEMIEAGVEVLWASGAIEHPLEADRLLVRDVYRAMQKALRNRRTSQTAFPAGE